MKEWMEAQELKLKKLRALRGQVEQYKASNGNLSVCVCVMVRGGSGGEMKERVKAQEIKPKKLRALEEQVEQYKASNGNQ